ncbi:hypothetical protein JXL83_07700, partial [candidate division WOR-3 bacterium]|nr:hypothetical protein [candidate division WOR-3 bacterium]
MKRIISVFSLLIPLLLSAEAYDLLPTETRMTTIYSNFSSIGLSAEFNSVDISKTVEDGQNFSVVNIENTHPSGSIGEPQIPVIRRLVEVPTGAQVSLNAVCAGEKDVFLTNRVYPNQPSLEKRIGAQVEFTIDIAAYSENSVYGEELARITDEGYIRGHRFVTIEVYPVRYEPYSGKLTMRDRIDVELVLAGSDVAATRLNYERYYNRQHEQFIKKMMLNAFAYGEESYPDLPIGYLIIVPDALVSGLTDFIAWKERKGYDVTVALKSQTGSTNALIKAYIQNAYDNWPVPPAYVLLIGDNEMPAYTGSSSGEITDHPYGQLQGGDIFHDVWLGRFSVTNAAQLTNIINKTLNYEQPSLWTQGTEWCKKAVFMASSDNHSITEGTHRYVIQNFLGPAGFACDTLWNYSGATTAQVSAAFNDGRSWGVYSGHGGTTSWADGPSFSQANVNALTNVSEYPIVMSYACNTGMWSVAECFAETWIRAGNKAGVSFWASAPSSYWTEDDTLERWVFKGMFDSSITWERGFYDYGLLGVYIHNTSVQYYYEAYNLFGDPSIDGWTDYPNAISVNYPSSIPVGGIDVQMTVNTAKAPVKDALICLKNDDSTWTGYTNASGSATIHVSNSTPCSLLVTVTGHDLNPHFGRIYVISSGAYVSYLRYIPAGNGQVNPGATYNMSVWVKNWGTQTAHNAVGTLSSADPNITVNQNTVSYGNINSNDSTAGSTTFNISVDAGLADGYSIPMTLTVTATESTWVSNFNISVNAPDINVLGYYGPPEILPGDTVEIGSYIKNAGSGTAQNVHTVLNSLSKDPYIVLLDSIQNHSQLNPGDSVKLENAYRIYIMPTCPTPYFSEFELLVQGDGGYAYYDTFSLGIGSVVFNEDFEGANTWTYTGSTCWHVTTRRSHSATHSMFSGNETGNYNN